MSTLYSESSYESAIIALFENMGYTHAYGPDVPRDFTSPLYDAVLEESLRHLNPALPEDAIRDALHRLKNIEIGALAQKNAVFMDYLQAGVPVRYAADGEERSAIVYLADYARPENNSFIVANQWTISENSTKRPDVLLFLNGLPVVVMELKSPSREDTDASEAYLQLRNYMQEIPSLFVYNAICVMSDQLTSKAGTITSGEDRFMEWKTRDGEKEDTAVAAFDTFFEGMFQKDRLLDIIKNFICFSNEGTKQKKILAGYHQYFAVKKAVESTRRAAAEGGDGKGGVFWHTQGSGKSLSMVFYAHLLQAALESPTIVVLTDRNDLDNQLFGQFARCREFLRQEPVQALSREHLKTWLGGRVANGIIFTTMQKFEESFDCLSRRRNIVVMADEAHRGQYGLTERVKLTKNAEGEDVARRVVGAARVIRNSLPNATYIGFTGTPIALKDRSTREVFGDYIDVYDMTQAVADGATRPVYYESRVVQLKLDKATLDLIDAEYDLMANNADPEVIEKSKRELGQMEAVLGNENTIASLVDDILNHYENNREHLLTGKAMMLDLLLFCLQKDTGYTAQRRCRKDGGCSPSFENNNRYPPKNTDKDLQVKHQSGYYDLLSDSRCLIVDTAETIADGEFGHFTGEKEKRCGNDKELQSVFKYVNHRGNHEYYSSITSDEMALYLENGHCRETADNQKLFSEWESVCDDNKPEQCFSSRFQRWL